MKCILTTLLSLLLLSNTSAQIDKLFSSTGGFTNEFIQLRPDGTYLYRLSTCTHIEQYSGLYKVSNDTVKILSDDDFTLPYFYKRTYKTTKQSGLKLDLENTSPDSRLKIYLNDTIQIFEGMSVPYQLGYLSTSFITMTNEVKTVKLLYSIEKGNEFTAYTISVDSVRYLKLFCYDDSSQVQLKSDFKSHIWLLKGDAIVDMKANRTLYVNPENIVVKETKRKRK